MRISADAPTPRNYRPNPARALAPAFVRAVTSSCVRGDFMSVKDDLLEICEEIEFVRVHIDEGEASAFIDVVSRSERVFCFGLGRAGFAMKSFAMRLMHMGKQAFVLTETITPSFGPGDLFVVASGSGETAQLVALAAKAKKLGGIVSVLTTNRKSTITRHADVVLQIMAPSKNRNDSAFTSQQPMASLFEQSLLLVCDAAVMTLARMTKPAEGELFSRHANLE